MNTLLAHPWHDGDGPGAWILLFPLIWAAVVAGIVLLLRRTVWRGRRGGPRPSRGTDGVYGGNSPITVLGRRFASGEIDEDEYWRRMSVLNEEFGRGHREGKDGPA